MADSEGAVAPGELASDAPPPAGWRIGGFAVAGGLVVSTIIHLLLVGTALFVGPPLLQSEPATAVTVDLVTPEELAAMSDKAAEPDKPQPAAAAPAQPPAEPAQSQPPVSAVASASEAFAMPFLPPPAPPSAPAPPDPKIGQAAQLAQLIGVPSVTDLSGGGPSDFKADLTPEEIAAFAAHVQSCWSAPAGLAQSPKLYVVMRVSLRRDGGLASEPLPIAGSASAEGPALAQSAKRALQQCQPHDALPAAKYDEWRLLDLRFTGSGITTASPVSHGQRTPRSG